MNTTLRKIGNLRALKEKSDKILKIKLHEIMHLEVTVYCIIIKITIIALKKTYSNPLVGKFHMTGFFFLEQIKAHFQETA